MLRIGTLLGGYCGGCFGRDSYEDKRIEAIGADWVVVRGIESGEPAFYTGDLETLVQFEEQPNYSVSKDEDK